MHRVVVLIRTNHTSDHTALSLSTHPRYTLSIHTLTHAWHRYELGEEKKMRRYMLSLYALDRTPKPTALSASYHPPYTLSMHTSTHTYLCPFIFYTDLTHALV